MIGILEQNNGISGIPLLNIVSEYKFEDNTNDTVGSNNGTATSITYVDGLVGRAGVFNGSTSNVDVADANNLSFGDGVNDEAFSVSCLVYINTLGNFQILEKKTATNTEKEYQLQYASGVWTFRLFDQSSGAQINANYSLVPNINTWYHLTGTYDGLGVSGLKLYFNGEEQTTNSVSGTYTAMENGTGSLMFGKYHGGAANTLNGYLDCVRIWNKELKALEVGIISANELAGVDINP